MKTKPNLDKFQVIVIGNKSKNENIKFNFDGKEILCENEARKAPRGDNRLSTEV